MRVAGGARAARGIARNLSIGGLVAASTLIGRTQLLRWGATDDEVGGRLPGDGLIPDHHLEATRAITIRRPPEEVWPWIAQLGQGRGGFYSYDFLENLVRCHIHSADRVVAAWQDIQPGGEVRLAPDLALKVVVADAPQALVLRGGVPIPGFAPPFDFSWAFVVHGGRDERTRLVVRERYRYRRQWARLMVEPVEVVSFVMTQRMLRGIRDRAEATGTAGPG